MTLSFSSIAPVSESAELRRILHLPRRVWAPGLARQLAEQWSPYFLNDHGRAEFGRLSTDPIVRERQLAEVAVDVCPLRLNEMQAMDLWEAQGNAPFRRGTYLNAAVGQGKTLDSRLKAIVSNAQRPLLTVKAALEQKTHSDFEKYDTYWRAPFPPIQVDTYNRMSIAKNKWILCNCDKCTREPPPEVVEGYRPDVWIADESSIFRNVKNVVRKVATRYFRAHPETIFYPMSATNLRKSIWNIEFIMHLALKDQCPIPTNWRALQEWAQALDFSTRDGRRHWGALKVFVNEDIKKPTLKDVRQGVHQRIADTYGVVLSNEQSCDKPIHIRPIKAPDDPVLDKAFLEFRRTKATLDGWDLDGDPLTQLSYGTEMSCGFHSKWDPRPPQYWLDARKEAMVTCRELMDKSTHSRKPLDSKKQVLDAYPNHPVFVRWREIEPTFKPNVVYVPVSMSVLSFCHEWIKLNSPALIWTQHVWVGETLSQITGLPYFRGKGLDSQKRSIDDHPADQSAILSTHANRFGRNLQRYNKALVVGPESSAEYWEQTLGREHRQGQLNTVYVDVVLSSAENLRALEMAQAEANFTFEFGGEIKKLLIAQFDWSCVNVQGLLELPKTHPSKARWTWS